MDLSVVIPAFNEASAIGETLDVLSNYLQTTGFRYELIVVNDGSTDETPEIVLAWNERLGSIRLIALETNEGKGAALRRGIQEAKGQVIAFTDADLPYRVQNLGHAIALVQSGSADLAIGARDLAESERDPSYPGIRRFMGKTFSWFVRMALVGGIPDTQCGLKAFSSDAARTLFGESRLSGFGFDFEILFLAKKYGFRIERIPVAMSHRHESKVRLVKDSLRMLGDLLRVRRFEAQGVYRSPRRCPVCFSAEVGSRAQIRGFVIRECRRCKCRYLNEFPPDDELERLYNDRYFRSESDLQHGYASRDLDEANRRTSERRLALIRKVMATQARVLEVGAGNGMFGQFLAREFDYVGIDLSDEAAREARARGLEVYRAPLGRFVNTGAAFDAVTLFHVFEHLRDPHDALARVSDLLKPGGFLFLITPDTESFLCAISGDRWVSYKLPEHLILYSRSALIELLEQSGFEIVSASADSETVSHPFLQSRLEQLSPAIERVSRPLLRILPDPMPVSSGSIRIVAKRRLGPPVAVRTIRAVEPTHAR